MSAFFALRCIPRIEFLKEILFFLNDSLKIGSKSYLRCHFLLSLAEFSFDASCCCVQLRAINSFVSNRLGNQVMSLRAHDQRFGELTGLQRFADALGRQQFHGAVDLWRVGIGSAYAAFFAHAWR